MIWLDGNVGVICLKLYLHKFFFFNLDCMLLGGVAEWK